MEGDYTDVSRFEEGTTWLHQLHGSTVVTVTEPGERAGAEADAAVTRTRYAKLAVRTADCVPIVLIGRDSIGVVHAGWRGLAANVVQNAIEVMGGVGQAHIGPHIRSGCYEFGAEDLDSVAAVLGSQVRSHTLWGTPSLDLTAATRAALGAIPVIDSGACTACSDIYFSWRARREAARFATIAWMS